MACVPISSECTPVAALVSIDWHLSNLFTLCCLSAVRLLSWANVIAWTSSYISLAPRPLAIAINLDVGISDCAALGAIVLCWTVDAGCVRLPLNIAIKRILLGFRWWQFCLGIAVKLRRTIECFADSRQPLQRDWFALMFCLSSHVLLTWCLISCWVYRSELKLILLPVSVRFELHIHWSI
jgi:hypothetical protein